MNGRARQDPLERVEHRRAEQRGLQVLRRRGSPAASQGNYGRAYWNITQSGGSSFTYAIELYYNPAMMGTVPFETNIRIAKRDGTNPWVFYGASLVDTAANAVSESGFTTFSDFTISDITSPLPVELVAFRARLAGNAVRLDWRTASELNAYRYYVERRGNGGWDELGFVNARGSVDTPSEYTFTDDRLPKASEFVYRLRMVDRDGSVEYSNEVRVATGTPDGFRVFANYPNPFNPGTAISFAIPAEQHVTVKVHDAAGREIETLQNGVMPAGTHAVTFFARDLPSGVYLYTVTAGAQIMTGRMILAR
ncbi:MAG: T9SS type A sorting domain-containing protein [Ignavibacteria bacterium]|nr:T9SS type A sorting domain-containing protein [Ignavibacteria bacterium]